MTDEEILKRMAEIEGLALTGRIMGGHLEYMHPEGGLDYFNPLSNWSDLGPLIEKYPRKIEKIDGVYLVYWGKSVEQRVQRKSLPHAVCLAIIEANNE